MRTKIGRAIHLLAIGVLFSSFATGTLIPLLSFEQLTDTSEVIVSGRIVTAWAAWDREHKYIWTHYTLDVATSWKGTPGSVVEFTEPGGAVAGYVMNIAGSVTYAPGENIVLFLSRMPNGYLRTTGWSQGKYALDAHGRVHGQTALGEERIDAQRPGGGSSVQTLEGMSLTELGQRISAQSRAVGRRMP